MKLKEKIENAAKTTAELIKKDPSITKVWYEFDNIELKELREVAKVYDKELYFSEPLQRMMLQLSSVFQGATIFCSSKKVKIKKHIVVDTAMKNI